MALRLHREYRIKNYLNASHYIISDGNRGAEHPHTWELSLKIQVARTDFVEFRKFETGINEYFKKYQNQLLNDIPPFTELIPTLENMVDFFAEDFYEIIKEAGGELIEIEAGESPTHTYILEIDGNEEENRQALLSNAVDTILDKMLDND